MKWVSDRMLVYTKIKGHWLLCEVSCAAGNLARVTNEIHSVNTWKNVNDLRLFVPVDEGLIDTFQDQ